MDFNDYKAIKEGKITPKILIENLLEAIEEGQIDSVVFIAKQNDGFITSGWTDMLHSEAIGLLEIAKLQVAKDMWKEL